MQNNIDKKSAAIAGRTFLFVWIFYSTLLFNLLEVSVLDIVVGV